MISSGMKLAARNIHKPFLISSTDGEVDTTSNRWMEANFPQDLKATERFAWRELRD